MLTHERFSPHKDMDLHSIKHRLTLKTKTFIISLIVETVCYYYNNILFFLALQLSRFQSNIIINYICRKISKIFLKPTAFWHILTYSSQMCPAIYLPAPALKLAHKSVRRQIAPPYIPSTLHSELEIERNSTDVIIRHLIHVRG